MTNAVYLIIAGALLGPIEAQPDFHIPKDEKWQACMNAANKSGAPNIWAEMKKCGNPAPAKPPTFNNACERAMKEIGARPVHSRLFENALGGSIFYGIPDQTRPVYGDLKRADVICIPAPSGLKR